MHNARKTRVVHAPKNVSHQPQGRMHVSRASNLTRCTTGLGLAPRVCASALRSTHPGLPRPRGGAGVSSRTKSAAGEGSRAPTHVHSVHIMDLRFTDHVSTTQGGSADVLWPGGCRGGGLVDPPATASSAVLAEGSHQVQLIARPVEVRHHPLDSRLRGVRVVESQGQAAGGSGGGGRGRGGHGARSLGARGRR
jgi:hypothetical protein